MEEQLPKVGAGHDPFSADTVHRVMDMAGRVCQGCRRSCGALSGRVACPLLRAKWFGDWTLEFVAHPPEVEVEEAQPLPVKELEPQLSLF